MSTKIGFGISDITPALGMEIPGGFSPRISTGVVSPLEARAAAFRNGEQALIIIGVDAVSIRFETVAAARARIRAKIDIPERRILIAASHTHCGGPANSVLGTEKNDEYLEYVADGIAKAAETAWNNACSASVAFGKKDCPGWAFNRRWLTRDGNHKTNPGPRNPDVLRPVGPVDPEVSILLAKDDNGKVIGGIGNFTCHSTVLWGNEFSPDYCAYWQKHLRAKFGGDFVLVFLNGACGDINQLDFSKEANHEHGVEHAEKMGAALAEAAIKAVDGKAYESDPVLAWAGTDVLIPLRIPSPELLAEDQAILDSDAPWDARKWQARDRIQLRKDIGDHLSTLCPVDVYKIGNAIIASSSWQPFCDFGLRLKQAAPGKVMVAMLGNGNVGYIPTVGGFIGGGYEPTLCRGSKHKPEAGDIIADASVKLIQGI